MIGDFLTKLDSYTDVEWRRYAFGREPLIGKLDEASRREFYIGALSCAVSEAAKLRDKYGDMEIRDICDKLGVTVRFDETPTDGVFATFATYSGGVITIYADNAAATDALIEEEGLERFTGGVRTLDVLLAHELFHHIEGSMPEIFTRQKHILLFKIGPLINRSRLVSLSEMTAMMFAKELTKLPCSAYLYDVLMLYAKNPQRAKSQYEMILRQCEVTE